MGDTGRETPPLPLWRMLTRHPRISDRGRARWRLEDQRAALATLPDGRHVRPLLAALADHSPFLWRLIEADPARLDRILRLEPRRCLAELLLQAREAGEGGDEAGLMCRLRQARQGVALLVAIADLGGAWTLDEVLGALSEAADAFLAAALAHLLRQAGRAGRLGIDARDPEAGCGLVLLALGKLGGGELNYSSDVDLIALYDPRSPALVDPTGAKTLYVRLVRDLIRILQQPTADGHVLRVDMRLRPAPEASAVANSIDAALAYYEHAGQTWERAALIKARPAAGDRHLGDGFLAEVAPFIWRRFLDFGTISDIHAMKRRIHAAKGGGAVAVAGHDVKLGRGGIRDIEFFAQTQQLIYGGRHPGLRGSRTLPMLKALRRDGRISALALDDLGHAYRFLRGVEHRLQMIDDAQTHRLPERPAQLERFSRFCGFAATAQFSEMLQRHLLLVAHHYGLLFEGDAAGGDVLSFSDPADDPGTLQRLLQLGFERPELIAGVVRGWLSGGRQATRSPRARELLPELIPKLLLTFSRTANPDEAVIGFDRSLDRVPAAAELFAILAANDAVRALHGEILGSAPPLARAVAAHPHLLAVALDPAIALCAGEDEMAARVTAALAGLGDVEDMLDAVRDLQHEEHFLIGTRLLSGQATPGEAALSYGALAVGVVRALLPVATRQLDALHGAPRDARVAVLAMGKLGAREMTATSDLDLVLVYDFDAAAADTDGTRPIAAQLYFARLTQRLVSALSLPTRRGRLYDVDMRLRPSGRQGPLATRFSSFSSYQRREAMSWEHMALTRARVVAGDRTLAQRLSAEIPAILRDAPRQDLQRDVAAMRALVRSEKPPGDSWDIKLSPGGQLDLEFIAQYVTLRDAAQHATTPAASPATATSTAEQLLLAQSRGTLPRAEALLRANHLLSATAQLMRLTLEPGQSPDAAARGVRLRMAEAVGVPSFAQLKLALAQAAGEVSGVFAALIGEP